MKILHQFICIAFLIILTTSTSNENYTLEFDWSINPISTLTQIGYITWNEQTLLTLINDPNLSKINHEKINVTFRLGKNELGIYFIGISQNLLIDNIKLSKDPKSLNLILNGNFQMCLFDGNFHTYKNKIPGWKAPSILIVQSIKGTNQLLLNNQSRTITQIISFGKVKNYQFTDALNQAIQKQAKDIIKVNLQSISSRAIGNGGNMWNKPINPAFNTKFNGDLSQMFRKGPMGKQT